MNTNIIPLDAETSSHIIDKMVMEQGFTREAASAILDETLIFMQMLNDHPGCGYGPSPIVDIGWHTFILHTRAYIAYCDRVFGHYLHHNPFNEVERQTQGRPIADTVAFMEQHGIVYDPQLWGPVTVNCCSGDNPGCSNCDDRALVAVHSDCDGGRGGGPSGCTGPGNCS